MIMNYEQKYKEARITRMKNSYFKLFLELYKEGESFNIYISDNNGGSGIVINGQSPEETANNTIPYIIDYMEELKK